MDTPRTLAAVFGGAFVALIIFCIGYELGRQAHIPPGIEKYELCPCEFSGTP